MTEPALLLFSSQTNKPKMLQIDLLLGRYCYIYIFLVLPYKPYKTQFYAILADEKTYFVI